MARTRSPHIRTLHASRPRSPLAAVAAAGAVALSLAACSTGAASGNETSGAGASPSSMSGSATGGSASVSAQLDAAAVTPGKLTIATAEPAYSPWVEDDDPTTGQGFEPAVAYAVAEKLGYQANDVVWTRTTFDAAVAPGPKDWDLNIQQFSITPERAQAVDFSSPYYTTAQAVVTVAGSPAAGATSLADLAGISFGAQTGTTSQTVLESSVSLAHEPLLFNNSADVVQALKGGQVQAIVVDLPTALYLVSAELDDGVVVGQFSDTSGGDQFGIVLPKGSAFTEPVSNALDALREDGTLAALEQQWLSDSADVPVLR